MLTALLPLLAQTTAPLPAAPVASRPVDAAPAAEAGQEQGQEVRISADETALLDQAYGACFATPRSPDGERFIPTHTWSEYQPQGDEPLAQLRAYWEAGAARQKAELTQFDLYRADNAEQPIYLLTTAIEGEFGPSVSGCRLLVPGSSSQISPAALEQWSGKKADKFLSGVQINETRWGVTRILKSEVDMSVSFYDPAIRIPPQATAISFHGTIIQFATSEA